MNRILAVFFLILLLTAPLLSVTAAPPAQDDSGIYDCDDDLTGKTIKFYHFGDLSGPYTFITAPVYA
ncbi:MAG TPA: hypothetical protein VJZ27_11305, partial [Aggregatilineales bacterium]|nr:hypothetical protein [Aggregatilineales bacterium]